MEIAVDGDKEDGDGGSVGFEDVKEGGGGGGDPGAVGPELALGEWPKAGRQEGRPPREGEEPGELHLPLLRYYRHSGGRHRRQGSHGSRHFSPLCYRHD